MEQVPGRGIVPPGSKDPFATGSSRRVTFPPTPRHHDQHAAAKQAHHAGFGHLRHPARRKLWQVPRACHGHIEKARNAIGQGIKDADGTGRNLGAGGVPGQAENVIRALAWTTVAGRARRAGDQLSCGPVKLEAWGCRLSAV